MTVGASERLAAALAERYSLQRELGSGGMATVHLAHDLKHGRKVAIKVLRPELAAALGTERFVREIEIAANLTHPHILPLFDSGEAGGFFYYVMPYLEGESLRDRLTREARLPVQEAVRLTAQIAAALAYAHEQGVVHRDIKPENILLAGDQAIVADFGIARAVEAAGGERLTGTGVAIGTPAYMSPEQAFGSHAVDGRTDVYALGCVVYEMVSGRAPFDGPTPQALLAMHAADTVPRLRASRSDIPLFVERAVERALAKDPADRFPTAAALAHALTTGTVEARVRPRRRRWMLLGVSSLAVAVLLVTANVRGLRDRLGWVTPAVAPIRLAVLPFENLTGDPEQGYFSDGLTDEIRTELSRLHPQRLSVIARTSSMQYESRDVPIDQIGRELEVDYVIEGSARRYGSRVRISATLIEVRDQTQRWSDSFDRELADILAVQTDVASGVARALALTLLPSEQTRLTAARPVNTAAYQAYLRGRFHMERLGPLDLDLALRQFELALAEDPDYAPAYAGIASVWNNRNALGYSAPGEAVPRARAAALEALELDSTLASAHLALGGVAWGAWDWDTSERAYRRAIDLDPSVSEAHAAYAYLMIALKRPAEALAEAERAMRLDPLNVVTQVLYGGVLYFVRRYDEAIVQLQNALAASPDNPGAHCNLWHAFNITNRPEDAVLAAAGCIGHYSPGVKAALTRGYAEAGYHGAMRRAADLLAAGVPGRYVAPTDVFIPLLHLGERDRAMEWLSNAVDARDFNVYGAMSDPLVHDRLGNDARFRALVERVGLPH